ncbi:MAG: S-adenosylmethionine:tRNA ribosyltransferase-isomerase, partial [Clostridiales bacterium]|nr:S-adenosylmethionine:tRNA ribosyltransferase-isomerase [Clostridiales bacterium]
MKKSDFYFDLPQELIAQDPIENRDQSRLLHMDRITGKTEHRHFYDILDYLKEGDCLVLNDTRVIPARIYGVKPTGARVEFLLLRDLGNDKWEVITGPGRKAKTGDTFSFNDGILTADILEVLDNGNRIALFSYNKNEMKNIYEVLDKIGEMPLPHYITHELKDNERYQTVYSKELGSAAAPTAGLHFTPELLKKIRDKGVETAYIT